MKKYESLKKQHSEYISLDKLHKICKISKNSARYLVENNIIASIDTGKKTWRYKISIDDVIVYLHSREQWGRTKLNHADATQNIQRMSYSQVVPIGNESIIRIYFADIYKGSPDTLGINDIIKMTGLCKKTLHNIIKSGCIKYILNGRKFIFPKAYFLDFIESRRFINIMSNSDEYIRILEDFKIWIQKQ